MKVLPYCSPITCITRYSAAGEEREHPGSRSRKPISLPLAASTVSMLSASDFPFPATSVGSALQPSDMGEGDGGATLGSARSSEQAGAGSSEPNPSGPVPRLRVSQQQQDAFRLSRGMQRAIGALTNITPVGKHPLSAGTLA